MQHFPSGTLGSSCAAQEAKSNDNKVFSRSELSPQLLVCAKNKEPRQKQILVLILELETGSRRGVWSRGSSSGCCLDGAAYGKMEDLTAPRIRSQKHLCGRAFSAGSAADQLGFMSVKSEL